MTINEMYDLLTQELDTLSELRNDENEYLRYYKRGKADLLYLVLAMIEMCDGYEPKQLD